MITEYEVSTRLVMSALFGAVIGLERERKNWSAGMRTHMMVCVGSALIMIVSAYGFADLLGTPHIDLDPSRIAAQVVSGIGFIGAGTILFMKPGIIRGLTTASGLWTVAAIGLATGQGMYFAAGVTTAIALVILWGLKPLERLFNRQFSEKTLHVTFENHPDNPETLNRLLQNKKVDSVNYTYNKTHKQAVAQIKFSKMSDTEMAQIIKTLEAEESVKEVFWRS